MFIAAHKFRAGFIGIFVGRTHHVAAYFEVHIEETINVVNPVVFFVSIKTQELIYAQPFLNLERDVPSLIQPITVCHIQFLPFII